MARIEEATQRLEAAFERLEQALAAGAQGSVGGGVAELRAELDEALRRNREVGGVAGVVAERLDRATDRVNAILES